MPKRFVIDTNVLLHTRSALEAFDDNVVVLPMTVIEELDRFKTRADELGRNARAAIRHIDGLREREDERARDAGRAPKSLLEGIDNNAGGKLMVMIDSNLKPAPGLETEMADNRIIRAARSLSDEGHRVVMVTKDLNLRIKSSVAGIEAQDWNQDKVAIDDLYPGFRVAANAGDLADRIRAGESVAMPGAGLFANEFVIIPKRGGEKYDTMARADGPDGLRPPGKTWFRAYGVTGRSNEQKIALQLLLDPSVKLVSLVGSAGTGKTLLALAAGLEALREEDGALRDGKQPVYGYEKLLVTRPIMPMGKDIGYLPGSKDNKLTHWMQPIFDNLAYLMQIGPGGDKHTVGKVADRKVKELLDGGSVELEALTYIRGRSIPRQFMIVDEAQNLTPHEIKTIISRAGEGTKIVLTGDPYQIDNPYLDSASNGLSYTVERLKHLPLFGHITLKKAERSDLSAAAADLL